MGKKWYALRSKPHRERILFEQVQAREIEAFFPQVRVKPANPRASRIRPYFPGYLFVRVNLEEAGNNLFQWMPFSQGLVSFGSQPASVPDHLIAGLHQRLQAIAEAGGLRMGELKAGAPVRVKDGAFKGYEGIFDCRLSGNERVRILLRLLGDRRVPLELHAGQIRALNQAH